MNMKRIGSAWIALMLLLGACAPAATPTPERIVETRVVEKPVEKTVEVTKVIPTLTVIGPWAGAEMDQFVPVLKAAEQKLGIQIRYRIYRAEDLAKVLPPQFEANQAPGDVIFMWEWWVRENKDHAVDLTDLWQKEAGAFVLQPTPVDGRIYAVPYVLWVKPGFWYKKSFFQKHNLQPPTTWEEFLALLDKIAAIPGIKKPIITGDGVGWPVGDIVEHFLIAFGGPELQQDLIAGKVKFTDPKVRAIFAERLVPLLGKYFSDPVEWTQAIDLWWNEEYGLFFMGNWLTGMVKDPNDLGVFPLPGTRGVVGGTDWAFIPKHSEHVEAAKQLIAFMISKEGMALRAQQGGKLASRKDVSPEVYPPADRSLAEALAKVEQPTVPDLDDAVGGKWQSLFWDQMKLLWVRPQMLDNVLRRLEAEFPTQ